MSLDASAGISAGFADWIAGHERRWSADALRQAQLSFVDTVGCMIAGGSARSVKGVVDSCRAWGTAGIPVAGNSARLALPWAALANGASAHALDFDDNLEPALGHASAVLVPSILACAAAWNLSGEDCLDAYIVGIEVMSKLGLGMNMDHYNRGWHSTVTLGTVAAAASVARLLRLDRAAASHALSISTSMAGGSKIQFGTAQKQVHAGLAAQSGIVAVQLARNGIDAASEAIDGPWGLRGLMSAASSMEAASRFSTGSTTMIERFGLMRKIYPCCAAMHRAIDGTLDARAQHNLSARSISRIEVRLAAIQTQNLRFPEPCTVNEARFSLEYCVASALVDGSLSMSAFTDAAIRRADVMALSKLVRMELDPDLHGDLPPDAETPTTLIFRLNDGRTIEQRIRFQRGHERNPLRDCDVVDKFLSLVQPVLGQNRSDELLRLLQDMPGLANGAEILGRSQPEPKCGATPG